MHTLAENDVQFEFQSSKIVKVSLGKSSILSTPVIRELAVYSKVKNGVYPAAYIISVNSKDEADESLWRVCRKAERFGSDILVAIVYPHNSLQANLQNFRAVLKPAGRMQVFETYPAALLWTEHKLNEINHVNQLNSSGFINELTA